MKYYVDVELSGIVAIKADDKADALEIAENLSTEALKDFLLNCKTQIVYGENLLPDDEKVFTHNDTPK